MRRALFAAATLLCAFAGPAPAAESDTPPERPAWHTPWVGFYAGAMSGVGRGNYIPELRGLSNVAFIGSSDPDLLVKLDEATATGMKAMISTRWHFFGNDGAKLLGAEQNWGRLKQTLEPYRTRGVILGFYLADEPYHNYADKSDAGMRQMRDWLNELTAMIRRDWPEAKTAFIEAYPVVAQHWARLELNPERVDWLGFDCYDDFWRCGSARKSVPWYYGELAKNLRAGQRLIAVPAVARPIGSARRPEAVLAALRCFDQMLKSDPRFVMTVPFLWQSFDGSSGGWEGASSSSMSAVADDLRRRGRPSGSEQAGAGVWDSGICPVPGTAAPPARRVGRRRAGHVSR